MCRAETSVMVNACTGKMGHAVAEAVVRAGLDLIPFSITGESEAVVVGNVGVSGIPVQLVGADKRQQAISDIMRDKPGLIVVDFTLPGAVNENAKFYCDNGLPFVMGTTGGDRVQLTRDTEESGVYAVIAPQMGKQVVAFQATMEMMAQNFPGAFSGYKLSVRESHQRTKVDTSGTAKEIVRSFQQLGVEPFEVDAIQRVREAGQQMGEMHVPEKALSGHAFHTYHLTSPDGTVNFEFQHNVVGREIYAEGTVDAVLFLASKIKEKAEQRIFNMVDVLRAGAMR
ncbi:hypothetical protein WJX73_009465 [Symbiochloris irregularis]|uniref:4-hydroxy-tetrahydrodipicolinate reductase n=1 Tax=Symbiochloris irregularis TaxID=706552 RepID=A0AAW1PSI6_9CHLO